MAYPNDEQQKIILAVINSQEQTVLVNACPGSGKTTLLVDIFQKCVRNWNHPGGVACLSFTNVAQEKIKNDFGNILPSKHFVGTFDSFIYNFIVKPYAHLLGYVSTSNLNIIENNDFKFLYLEDVYCATEYKVNEQGEKEEIKIRKPAINLEFINIENDVPVISYEKNKFINKWTWENIIKIAKQDLWKKGIANYSDIRYLALEILNHPEYGQHIIDVINFKFPYIFIDELQDTGYYLEEILLLLMKNSKKNFLIGDSDQAIYDFAEAKARIFTILEKDGINAFTLTNNFRSCSNITNLISDFSFKEQSINAQKTSMGQNILIVHSYGNRNHLPCEKLKEQICSISKEAESFAILARRNTICNRFQYQNSSKCPVSSALAKKLNYILNDFFNKDRTKAFKNFEKCIGELLFESKTDFELSEQLTKNNINSCSWKRELYSLIHNVYKEVEDETWNNWLLRVNNELENLVNVFNLEHKSFKQRLKQDNKNGNAKRIISAIKGEEWSQNITRIDTIHGVKGEEFDTCLIYCEKPSDTEYGKCPSITWWDNDEEKRIIFVGLSRAKNNLILCIHKDTYDNVNKDINKKKLFEHFNQSVEI